jgi:3-methyladenine DNA glycosylase AlkD
MIEQIVDEIKKLLKKNAPELTSEQRDWICKIINSNNPKFKTYGLKIKEIENVVKSIFNKYECSYEEAIEIFKNLFQSDLQDEKFAGLFFLNHFKKYFDEQTIELVQDLFALYCQDWAICDSTCIRVIGPFLGKQVNKELAKKTIDEWSASESMWIRRASMVILLKIIMLNKNFNEIYVFEMVEKMSKYPEDYIHKASGWLLKTCSKYNPDSIFKYLMQNKNRLNRLILRYASEKLPKEKRALILKK